MKYLFSLIFICTLPLCFSQSSAQILDMNDVKLRLRDEGVIFNNELANIPGYEVPKGSGRNAIYAGAFWFAGIDQNGILRNACARYNIGKDFFSGPYSNNGSYNDPVYLSAYNNSIWTVSNWEIQYHISNFNQIGYVLPNGIANWPGNGVQSLGVVENLAPFVDVDGDNIYQPMNGDYPDIRGDNASYIIMNDAAGIHTESGGEPMGIEIHLMVYQYVSLDYLNSTSFINLRVFNRGNYSFNNFRTGFWMDGDIGFYGDDYIGCDSTRNVIYCFNGDNTDEDNGGALGYGLNPPSIGVVSLTNPISTAGYYSSASVFPAGEPTNAIEFWNALNARGQNGTHWVYGGTGYSGSSGATTTPTNFMYSGNPYTSSGWTESGNLNPPGDRRSIFSLDSVEFNSNQMICNDFAIVYSRLGNNLENVQGVINLADSVKQFFDSQIALNCNQVTAGIESSEFNKYTFYPNPSSGQLTFSPNEQWTEYSIEVTDISGKLVYSSEYKTNEPVQIDMHTNQGVYILSIKVLDDVYTERIVISK